MTDRLDGDRLHRLREGDRQLFAELVRDHHRALMALVQAMVGASHAEEVVQSAWLKAYLAIGQFEGRSSVRTWLGSIALNEARMHLRQTAREVSLDALTEDAGDDALAGRFDAGNHWRQGPAHWHGDSPEGLLMQADLADCLQRLLTSMPQAQRLLLELRDVHELPFDEICNTVGVSASNARVLLHRARRHLFALVDHYQETGEC